MDPNVVILLGILFVIGFASWWVTQRPGDDQ